jgi:hypothetical protein
VVHAKPGRRWMSTKTYQEHTADVLLGLLVHPRQICRPVDCPRLQPCHATPPSTCSMHCRLIRKWNPFWEPIPIGNFSKLLTGTFRRFVQHTQRIKTRDGFRYTMASISHGIPTRRMVLVANCRGRRLVGRLMNAAYGCHATQLKLDANAVKKQEEK